MKRRRSGYLRIGFFGALLLLLLICAILGAKAAPHDPYGTNFLEIDQPPSLAHFAGTDNLGRDIFSRIITGTRTSLAVTFFITGCTLFLGTALGVLAGYFGGIFDRIIMRIVLIFQSFPGQIMAIAVAGILGVGIGNAAIALAAVGWPAYARLSRSLVLRLKGAAFINAAKLYGCGPCSIIVRHILPNISTVMFINAMTTLSSVMLELSALSFLGLSSKPPYPEWGFMVSEGRKVLMTAPWQSLAPGAAILFTVIVLNRFSDSVQDAMDLADKEKA